jgi:hypothetical protein
MLIEVTQADIEAGQPCKIECCPVALAIKRIMKTNSVIVEYHRIMIDGVRYGQQDKVINWMVQFDKGKQVGELKFDI